MIIVINIKVVVKKCQALWSLKSLLTKSFSIQTSFKNGHDNEKNTQHVGTMEVYVERAITFITNFIVITL